MDLVLKEARYRKRKLTGEDKKIPTILATQKKT